MSYDVTKIKGAYYSFQGHGEGGGNGNIQGNSGRTLPYTR